MTFKAGKLDGLATFGRDIFLLTFSRVFCCMYVGPVCECAPPLVLATGVQVALGSDGANATHKAPYACAFRVCGRRIEDGGDWLD